MATSAKINLKNMDYFKFRKYVIDGNRDETSSCNKEVASLCACVQTLNLRDDEFDPGGQDWARFDEICAGYKQIIQGKRVEPVDVRIKSGWWGEQKSGLSVGKIKASLLLEVLVAKSKDWFARHGESARACKPLPLEKVIDGPGIYVFKHKERPCFQIVQSAVSVFQKCSEFLKSSFEGVLSSPLTALIAVSLVSDWDFYFVPVSLSDNEEILRVVENDLILKHDTIWPHGLNLTLTLQTTFDVVQFRKSCVRHKWPPERDSKNNDASPLNVDEMRNENHKMLLVPTTAPTSQTNSNNPEFPPSPTLPSPPNERPSSAKSPPTKTTQATSANQPKTPRPSTASKAHGEQKRLDTSTKTNFKSPVKPNSTSELNKSHLSQTNKDKKEQTKHEPVKSVIESARKTKSKENKSPDEADDDIGKEEAKRSKDVSPESPSKENLNKNSTEEENGEPHPPLKRSNTFTYEDNEQTETTPEVEEGKSQKLTLRANAAAKRLATQQH